MTATQRLSAPQRLMPTCPRCGGGVHRIRRRFVDRVISLLRPVRRYECERFNCRWVGDLRYANGRLGT